jgi:folate-dependent phosphoribosylglycinamide formyltransferase PurN
MHLVINIHPGPLPETGGKGMHGLHVHKHVIQLLNEGRRFDSYNGIEDHITQISIHAVEDFDYAKKKYDTGKLLFRRDVPLDTTPIDTLTPETLENIVHPEEHFIYPLVIDLWTHGDIFFIKDTVYQSDRTVRFIKTLYQFDMGNITKDELMRDFIESRNMHT